MSLFLFFFKKLPDVSRMQPGLRTARLGKRLTFESYLATVKIKIKLFMTFISV